MSTAVTIHFSVLTKLYLIKLFLSHYKTFDTVKKTELFFFTRWYKEHLRTF